LVVVAGTFGVRALQQALDMGQSLEMHRVTDANRSLLFGYVVAAAMYNFTFVAMLTLRLLERLRALSQRDPLTGLLNRRALDEELAREWSRMKRGGPAFAVLALDIDHFKQVNDRHGHLAGDALLEQLARRLHQTARQTDIVARVGGEEFVVVAPNATAEGAQAAASRLLGAVREGRFELPAGPVSATVSVGVALSRAGDASVQDVFKRADDALYQAKALGRDRVCIDPRDALARAPVQAPLRATA
jgi:diguanylate cyclase (GGDEF)-like protein